METVTIPAWLFYILVACAGFVIGSILFLAFSINMFVGFANSFPSPSKEWVTNMALSRAYTLGEYPVIDDKLITQGRITTSGMGIVALVFSAMLATLPGALSALILGLMLMAVDVYAFERRTSYLV